MTTPDDAALPAAGLSRRLLALLYDLLLLVALWLLTTALLLAATGGQLAARDRPLWELYLLRSALVGVTFLFCAGFWTHGGQTLGMRAWRLKLESADGRPVSWSQAARRFAAAGLALAPAGLGYLWVLIDREHRAWHDRLSGTRVVLLPKAQHRDTPRRP